MRALNSSLFRVGVLVVMLTALFFERSDAEACGFFLMEDLKSGEKLSFDHSMVRLTRIKHSQKSILVRIRGYQMKVPLYGPYLHYDRLGSAENMKATDIDCTNCWSPKEVRRNLKLLRGQSVPAIWFEEGRIRVHGRLVGSWSADGMTLGDEKYSVRFGSDLGGGLYKSMEVTRGKEVVLRGEGVTDVCVAAAGERKAVKNLPMELSYRKGIWRRVALYLIAKHAAN